MLFNLAGAQVRAPFTSTTNTTVVPAVAGKSIFVYEIIGSNSLAGTVDIKSGSTIMATEALQANQGITWSALANMEGEPRFATKPGEALVVNSSTGTFTGDIQYAYRD